MKKQRIYAIDLGRGASVVMMVLVHSLWMYGDAFTQYKSWFGEAVHLIGRGTPMFLLAMGFSFYMSKRQSPMESAIRGLSILAMGYMMNTLKFLVPIKVFGTMPETFIEAYSWHSPLSGEQLLYLFATGDILQMAGLALFFMGVVRRFVTSRRLMLAIAFAVAALSGVIQGYRPGIPYVDGLADLLWGMEWNVYFPVVPWISVIFFGMSIGMHLREVEGDPQPVFRALFPLGLLLTAVGGALCVYWPETHMRDFFHLGPGGAIHLMGVSALLFCLARALESRVLHTWFGRLLCHCSERVTSLYIIHWVLICWGMGILGFRELGALAVTGLWFVMLGLTLVVDIGLRALRSAMRGTQHLESSAAPS